MIELKWIYTHLVGESSMQTHSSIKLGYQIYDWKLNRDAMGTDANCSTSRTFLHYIWLCNWNQYYPAFQILRRTSLTIVFQGDCVFKALHRRIQGQSWDGARVSGEESMSWSKCKGWRWKGLQLFGNAVLGNMVLGNTFSVNTVAGHTVSGNTDEANAQKVKVANWLKRVQQVFESRPLFLMQ